MKTLLIILLVIFILFILLFLFCACKVASIADEELEKEFKRKN